jgi:hypothetical protein
MHIFSGQRKNTNFVSETPTYVRRNQIMYRKLREEKMITMPLMQKNGTVTLWQVINKKSQELSPK